MINLSKAFVLAKRREKSGSGTSNAYDYQKDWALCKLLSLHLNQNDYLLILDYHEDIVVFDSDKEPNLADFYQVKKRKSANWTINSLVKRKDANKISSSIIGKIFENEQNFEKRVRSLNFVSNQGLSCNLKDGSKGLNCSIVHFHDLNAQDKKKIRNSVHSAVSDYTNVVGLNKFSLVKTELGIETHSRYTKGKLVEFFETICPDKPIATSLAYTTIFDEIRRKTNHEGDCLTYSDLQAQKTISYKEFAKIIRRILDRSSSNETWKEVAAQLRAEGFVFTEIQRIKSGWQKYIVDRMDAENEPCGKLQLSIGIALNEAVILNYQHSLRSLVKIIRPLIYNFDNKNLFDNEYLEAAVICEAIQNDSIPKTNQKHEEETA